MKLSDVVSSLELPIFAELPLLIFFALFVLVCVHVLRRSQSYERASALPLEERDEAGDAGEGR